jgi:hypothetical protein
VRIPPAAGRIGQPTSGRGMLERPWRAHQGDHVTHRFAPFAIALTLVLAACGTTGEGESGDTTSTTQAESSTTSETTTSTTTEPEVDEAAQARAEAVDVTLDDFPAGWESSPHEVDDDEDLITLCSEFDLEELSLAVHNTDDFSIGDLSANDGQSMQIGTRIFEDEATAESILDVMPQDDFIACANQELESTYGEGSVEGEVEARQFEGIGDQTEGFSGQLQVVDSNTGETVSVQLAFVAIRTGDLVTGLTAVGVGQGLDTSVLDDLGDRIVELQESA